MEQREHSGPTVAEQESESLEPIGDTGRLEAFSDGVFAIAVTLLVLNLRVPVRDELGHSLLVNLARQWPSYIAYIISFAFILIMWVNHHRMFTYIARADHNLLIFNGVLLFFVTVVPFPTSLLATYLGNGATGGDQVTAAVVYSGTYVLTAVAFNLVWFWAARERRLLEPTLHPRRAEEVTRRYRFGPLLYLLCVALAFVNVYASLGLNIALAVFFAWPHGTRRASAPHETD